MKEKIYSNLFFIVLVFLSIQFARGYVPIVQETHFYSSKIIDFQENLDLASSVYLFLRTPIYELFLDFIFSNRTLFFIFSYLGPLLLILNIYFLMRLTTKNNFFSLLVALFFLSIPVLVKLFNLYTEINFYEAISFIYPRFDIWFRTFSVRQIHGIIFLISLMSLYREKYYWVIFLSIFNLIVHPNSAVITNSFFAFYFLMSFYLLKQKTFKFFVSILLVTILYSYYKISFIESIQFEREINSEFWYKNLIRDEVDDFSILYRFFNNKLIFVFYFLLFTFFTFKIFKKKEKSTSAFLIFSILFIYFLFFFIEILINYFNFYFLANIFIPLQPGWKTVGYSIFPLFIYFYNEKLFSLKSLNKIVFYLLPFLILFFLYYGFNKNLNKYNEYFRNILVNNDSYAFNLLISKNFDFARVVYNLSNKEIDEIDFKNVFLKRDYNDILTNEKKKYSESFKKKFNTDECLKNLVSFNNFIDDHEGLIVPPYFYNFRDLFYKKNIFYTEHHDGNLSMGNIKFFSIFNERMNSLLNVNYLDLPPKTSGFLATYIRNIYFSLDEKDFRTLKSKYEKYNYIMTEKNHEITGIKKVKEGKCFNLYEIE